MNAGRLSWRVRVAIAVLGLLAAVFLAWPVYRAFRTIDIDYNEGWNAHFADAALGRDSLYPSRDRLVSNNYPPLSFYAVGGLGRLVGDHILAGRLLSLAAVVGIGVGVAVAARQLGGSWAGGAVGGLYWVATLTRFFTNYTGMNDPQLLAQAVMTGGLLLFLRARGRDRGYLPALAVMVAAGFAKHNLVVVPSACMIWLAVRRPRRLAVVGPLVLGLVVAGFAACHAVYGPDFFANLLTPRGHDVWGGFVLFGRLQWVAVGLVVWAYVGVVRRGQPGVNFCSLLIALGVVNFFVQMTGDGVADNAQFELVFGAAVGVGLAFTHAPHLPLARRWSPDALRVALLLAVCVRLLASGRLEPVRVWVDPAFHREMAAREAALADAVARTAATPGEVATHMAVSFRAGKRFSLDPFTTAQRISAGKLPADAIEVAVAEGRLTVVEYDPQLSWTEKASR